MEKIIRLSNESIEITHLCRVDKRLAKVISMVGDMIYKPYEDGYAFLVHEIIEQMLSIKAGAKIYSRLEELCGGKVTVEAISNLSDEELKSIGTSNSKVLYIRELTNAIIDSTLKLDELITKSDAEVCRILMLQKGIGSWTAKMYMIFVLDRKDILPYEDVAFLQSYKWMYKTDDISMEAIVKKCKKWKPYSSIAARYLYRALDLGLTKKEFHLFKLSEDG